MCRVDTFNIKGRVRLGITQRLCLAEYVSKVTALVAHLGEDEVTGTINDTGQPVDLVCRQAFTQCLDNRDTASHGRFEGDHDTFLLCRRKYLVAMQGDQCLVGGHHMLAVGNRLQYQLAGRFVATNKLNNDVDIGIINNRKGIVADADGVYARETRGIIVTRSGLCNADATTGAPGDFLCITIQHIKRATTHCAEAQQANINRIQLIYPPDIFDCSKSL